MKIIVSDPKMPLGISKWAPGDVGTLIFKRSAHRAVTNYVRSDKEVTWSDKAIIWKNNILKSKAIQKGTLRQDWQCNLAHFHVLLSRMGGGEGVLVLAGKTVQTLQINSFHLVISSLWLP